MIVTQENRLGWGSDAVCYGKTVTGLIYAYNPTTGQLKHFASIDEAKAAAYQMKEANDRKEAADRRKFNLMNSMQ
jgi:hypothetical protein